MENNDDIEENKKQKSYVNKFLFMEKRKLSLLGEA